MMLFGWALFVSLVLVIDLLELSEMTWMADDPCY